MAELTSKPSPDVFGTKAGPKSCKLPSKEDTGTSPLNPNQPFENLIYVRYLDHVLYNRSSALMMKPQTREAVGWLIYDCPEYIVLSWDKDADPPTLHGGDAKASGLVLLRTDIVRLVTFYPEPLPLQKSSNWSLNRKEPIQEDEYAFRPTERKTRSPKSKGEKQP